MDGIKRSIIRVSALCAVVLAAHSSNAQGYDLTIIGTLGYENSRCTFISDSGEVLGATWTEPHGLPPLYHGFVYRDNKMTPLQPMPGLTTSYPTEINASGVIVGSGTGGYEGPAYPAMWNSELNPSPPGGWPRSFGPLGYANDINDAGQVILNIGYGQYRAFLWQNGRATELVPNLVRVSAGDINELGQIVGYWGYHGSSSRAFLWQEGIMTVLPGTSSWAVASGINNRGTICGQNDQSAVLWKGEAISYLPEMRSYRYSTAYAINEQEQVLGTVYTGNGDSESVLWENGRIIRLNGLITMGAPFISVSATSINNLGQICGYGQLADGTRRGFILTPRRRRGAAVRTACPQANGQHAHPIPSAEHFQSMFLQRGRRQDNRLLACDRLHLRGIDAARPGQIDYTPALQR